MFGIMQHLNVSMFDNAEMASAAGYSKESKYADAKPVEIIQVVVVRNGTKGGNSAADLILADQEGNKYVVMVTGNLLKSLPV
jgi:hypothetical protein